MTNTERIQRVKHERKATTRLAKAGIILVAGFPLTASVALGTPTDDNKNWPISVDKFTQRGTNKVEIIQPSKYYSDHLLIFEQSTGSYQQFKTYNEYPLETMMRYYIQNKYNNEYDTDLQNDKFVKLLGRIHETDRINGKGPYEKQGPYNIESFNILERDYINILKALFNNIPDSKNHPKIAQAIDLFKNPPKGVTTVQEDAAANVLVDLLNQILDHPENAIISEDHILYMTDYGKVLTLPLPQAAKQNK